MTPIVFRLFLKNKAHNLFKLKNAVMNKNPEQSEKKKIQGAGEIERDSEGSVYSLLDTLFFFFLSFFFRTI